MVVVQTTEAAADLARLKAQLSQQAIGQAMARAINRTVLHERTVSIRAAKKKYNFDEGTVSKYKEWKATYKDLRGYFQASNGGTALHKVPYVFEPGKGVTFQIIKGKTSVIPYAFQFNKKGAGPLKLNGAFFARGVYAGKGFTKNVGRESKPISLLRTLSLYQAIAGQVPRVQLNQDAKAWYDKTFRNELNYQVLKATGQVR